MNNNFGKSATSLNNFDFDLGISSNRGRSLNDQKLNRSSPSSFSSSSHTTAPAPPAPSWQPNKPSWTHQPAPGPAARSGLPDAPSSMVGDIFGKSWASAAPSTGKGGPASVEIVNKNPNLFGDLVNLGQRKSNSNVPLKNAAPATTTGSAKGTSYSMGNLADSLPKSDNSESFGSFTSSNSNSNKINSGSSIKSTNFGGPSMRNSSGNGVGMGAKKDPFASLAGFGSRDAGSSLNAAAKSNKVSTRDDTFGNFQNASKPSATASSSNAYPANNSTNSNSSFMGSSSTSTSSSKVGDFGIPNLTKDHAAKSQAPVQPAGTDPLDMFFTSSSVSAGAAAAQGAGTQQSSDADDWGWNSGFGGGDEGTTTELEGLPPPPAGVSASAAKNKGMDNQKQGQYADAIKWLSWAVVLHEKAGQDDSCMEVLSCRSSCYKEVGEYKKAVADCTKVLEHDSKNVSVLVQRALLYESMEKYKLGAEDLRTVMKLDPGNRVARSTIHRLTKLAE